jgi:3'-phosphoadenosine 5'-phosphosulfate sulfotransferase (PAPS reductase)/FAD synthetase
MAIGPACVLYSGGKDSTITLRLALEQDPGVLVMHNNTTLGSDATIEWIRKTTEGLNYIETTPDEAPVEMWQTRGHWPILGKRTHTEVKRNTPGLNCSPVQCCYHLKEKPANRVLTKQGIKAVIWGNRAGESMRRRMSFVDSGFLFKPKKYTWHQAYPIQHWTGDDVKEWLEENAPDFPVHKSTESGCMVCATDLRHTPNNLMRLHQQDPEKWRDLMESGMGAEIAKINGLDPSKIDQILDEAPEALLRARPKRKQRKKAKDDD